MSPPSIAVSGVHSDSDPSPGIGIARSLREAFPSARLTAVDYSVRSSGLHHPVFDDVLLQPVWSELDVATYAKQVRRQLDEDAGCWISGLDVECDWLADAIGEHARLLVPNAIAQRLVRKPEPACAPFLRMHVPEFLPASSTPTDLHALGRRSGWRLWVKGKYHEAYAARGFAELRRQIHALEAHWPLEDIFVQQHVSGLERSITFAAYNGSILDVVEVEKRSVTSQGKTWAAAVTKAPPAVVERLASLVAEVRWTGGGEVEFVRDAMDVDWLIDFNPRFPAYIYGVTLCGHNLPACLVRAALGTDFVQKREPARQFIRVVHEVAVHQELPLPRIVPAVGAIASVGKHPSFQPELVRRLRTSEATSSSNSERFSPAMPVFLADWRSPRRTPMRFRNFESVKVTLGHLAAALEKCSAMPRVIPAFSVKTDPHPELARAFLGRGWRVEVISLPELEWAREMGFKDSEIVLNGPSAVAVASTDARPIAVAFADSVEALESLLRTQCETVGLRVRSGAVSSRFGVDLADYRVFKQIVHLLKRCGTDRLLGIHMHFASDVCGPIQWRDLVEHALSWSEVLADVSGAAFSTFDIGGGWHSDDFRDQFIPSLPALQSRIANALPSVKTILLEPGKAVAADTAWLATRVLEVRACKQVGAADVVVDASIADLPMASLDAHRVVHLRNGRFLGWLTGGSQRILGSICMEIDILAEGVAFPQPPSAGDELLFSSAGGYNASMAWHFASGVSRDT